MRRLNRKFVKKMKILLCVIVVVFVGLFIYKSFTKDDPVGGNGKNSNSISYNDYVIEKGHFGKIEKYDPSYTVEGYKGGKDEAYYINGKITSKTAKSFVIITFNLYDKSNKLLGTAVAGLNGLQKGKTYNFKALSLIESKYNQEIDHYKLKDIK